MTKILKTSRSVNYSFAARRHMTDAEHLLKLDRQANAGQLFGFAAECGLKALLIASGAVKQDDKGEIPRGNGFRAHIPNLCNLIAPNGQLLPDGSCQYFSGLAHLTELQDWSIDQRYWTDDALPARSVEKWKRAAQEVLEMADSAMENGHLL